MGTAKAATTIIGKDRTSRWYHDPVRPLDERGVSNLQGAER